MSGERGGGVVAKTAAQTGLEVVLSEHLPSELTDPKFTAAQIDTDCPPQLQDLAKEITEGLEKVYEQKKLAADQVIAVKKLIDEVKALCDPGGFAAFREKFFPNLRKSRVYELLAIASKKKTIEETRASNRLRVARHRSKKTEAPDSVTVMDNTEPAAQGSPEGQGEIEAPSIASEQTQEAASGESVFSRLNSGRLATSTPMARRAAPRHTGPNAIRFPSSSMPSITGYPGWTTTPSVRRSNTQSPKVG
jgi:hypothetical protein